MEFQDLIELEDSVGSVAALTLLFVESPGAIAELGSFAVLHQISDTLMVVADGAHETDESFIRHGPIARRKSQREEAVQYYYRGAAELGPGSHPASAPAEWRIEPEDCADLCAQIKTWLSGQASSQRWKSDHHAHRLWMMSALTSSFPGLKEGEIASALLALGCTMSDSEVRQSLWVLAALEVIERRAQGHSTFYFSRERRRQMDCGFVTTARLRSIPEWEAAWGDGLTTPTEARRRRAYQGFNRAPSAGKGDGAGHAL